MARSPAFLPPALVLAAAGLLAAGQAAAAPVRTGPVRTAPPHAPNPQVTLAALEGVTEAQARARIGAPDLARAEGLGALWTYRLQDCALLVFFRSEAAGAPRRLSGALSSPRRRGETPPTVDACLAEAAARAGRR